MKGPRRSEEIRERLIKESKGSFSIVRQAIEEATRDTGKVLDVDDVTARIRRILQENKREVA